MKDLGYALLCRHDMCPVEDTHSQKEEYDLRYLESNVKLEVILHHFFFICKV